MQKPRVRSTFRNRLVASVFAAALSLAAPNLAGFSFASPAGGPDCSECSYILESGKVEALIDPTGLASSNLTLTCEAPTASFSTSFVFDGEPVSVSMSVGNVGSIDKCVVHDGEAEAPIPSAD